jgi:secretion/DNA translocation related TadE-like protein
MLSMTLSAVGVARARASAAADLAALAGAGHLFDGSGCHWARDAALRNSANLSDCRVSPSDITVSVSVPVRLVFPRLPASASMRATARAGTTPGVATRG